MNLGWYVRRLRKMSAGEIAGRSVIAARQRLWAVPSRRPNGLKTLKDDARIAPRMANVALRRAQAPGNTVAARAVIEAADGLLAGRWPIFHLDGVCVGDPPDWFTDPLTGTAAPATGYAFNVDHRKEAKVGNIKFVWELSRHQAVTVLACAWWLTGQDSYAEGVARHLRSWWAANPFLTGVHWTSGIEVGLRLLAWTWIRALLSDWPGVRNLFDENTVFLAQLYHHQLYVRRFHSLGSSANNHLIAELAGAWAAALAFPWYGESAAWEAWAGEGLARATARQTHEDGWNREQASSYHFFVFDMLAAAAIPARLAGRPLPRGLADVLARMADAWAACLDAAGRPPRFGDSDEGRGVLIDAPRAAPALILLDVARALAGAQGWWPEESGSVLGHVARIAEPEAATRAQTPRPAAFEQSGVAVLRTQVEQSEIWVRCDGGPHGFLSIAAHGHADALSVELRVDGVDVLADPGTYCYHGEPAWRAWFKGTAGHNTLLVDGVDQAVSAGPFLWTSHPRSAPLEAGLLASSSHELPEPAHSSGLSKHDAVLQWGASHDGYARLADPVTHCRNVALDCGSGCVTITDWIDAAALHDVQLPFHLGPEIGAELQGSTAHLDWAGRHACLALPPELAWSLHKGEENPPCGWHSTGFGHRVPTFSLIGRGRIGAATPLVTRFSPPSSGRDSP